MVRYVKYFLRGRIEKGPAMDEREMKPANIVTGNIK